jgi:hypothetical protein
MCFSWLKAKITKGSPIPSPGFQEVDGELFPDKPLVVQFSYARMPSILNSHPVAFSPPVPLDSRGSALSSDELTTRQPAICATQFQIFLFAIFSGRLA